MDVKQKANRLIKKYHTDNPFMLAKAKNITVMYGNLGGKYGNYLKYRRSKFIIIDDSRTPRNMMPFICAHELGHAICTPDANTKWLKTYTTSLNADRAERQANQFAVELMLNDALLRNYQECSIYRLAEIRGVPKAMIGLKKFIY